MDSSLESETPFNSTPEIFVPLRKIISLDNMGENVATEELVSMEANAG